MTAYEELLARLDERTKAMQADTAAMRMDLKNTIEIMSVRLNDLDAKNGKKIDELESKIEEKLNSMQEQFVSKAEFNPIRILVYGFVGVVILTVLGALISTVIIKP